MFMMQLADDAKFMNIIKLGTNNKVSYGNGYLRALECTHTVINKYNHMLHYPQFS